MTKYEVEIKSLLGSKERADALRARMQEVDPQMKLVSQSKQLNHYFIKGDIQVLAQVVRRHLTRKAQKKLDNIADTAKEFSVRTRDKDGTVYLVAKASVDDTTSENGIARMEFEEPVALTLAALDNLVLSAGFSHQAKWSREREEYECKGANVCLDKNAGYGWLAEFEKIVQAVEELERAQEDLRALMVECRVEELPQDRLERMFTFYNSHWPAYYGTEKIFTVE